MHFRFKMIQPQLSQEEARDLLENTYGIKDIIALKPLPSFEDQNFHVTAKAADDLQPDYVLKIMNNVVSQNPDICSVQSDAMAFLRERGFPTPMTFPTSGGELLSFFSVGKHEIVLKDMEHVLSLSSFMENNKNVSVLFQQQVLQLHLNNSYRMH